MDDLNRNYRNVALILFVNSALFGWYAADNWGNGIRGIAFAIVAAVGTICGIIILIRRRVN